MRNQDESNRNLKSISLFFAFSIHVKYVLAQCLTLFDHLTKENNFLYHFTISASLDCHKNYVTSKNAVP